MRDLIFTDIGIGDAPATTLESVRLFSQLSPNLVCYGLDIDPARIENAKLSGAPQVFFEQCTEAFETPSPVKSHLVRAMNVLRSYTADHAEQAHQHLSLLLKDGGLLIEGSCSPSGDRMVAHLLRQENGSLFREGLIFFTDFSHGHAPWLFRDWLPCDLRRSTRPGTAMYAFLHLWNLCWLKAQQECSSGTPGEVFSQANDLFASKVGGVDATYSHDGYLIWSPERGIPTRGDSRELFEQFYGASGNIADE